MKPRTRPTCLLFAGLCATLALSCSKREENLPPPAARVSAPSASEPVRAPAARPAADASPAAAATAGADLEKVALDSAAFSDLVDSLRKFAGEEVEANPATLDLDSFVRGKSERDLLKFAQNTNYKSPYAAMQVLEYLWRQCTDVPLRIEVARLFGELAADCGYDKDRALAHECADWMAGIYADPGWSAAMSRLERESLINDLRSVIVRLDGFTYAAEKWLADVIRNSARSDLDAAYADTYDAHALIHTGRAENVPALRRLFESIRARGAYGRYTAKKESVDRWLSLDEATFAAEIRETAELMAPIRERQLRERRQLEPLTPAERIAEMIRQAEAAKTNRPARKDPS